MVAGRRLARPPLPAIRDLDRAPPPPQALGRHPPPPPQHPAGTPSDRPAQRWPSQPVGGGGAPGHPCHGISSAKNGSADFGGLKIDPLKSMSLQFLHQKVRRLFLGRYWKNYDDRTNTLKDIRKKTWGEGRICPPPLSSARVKGTTQLKFPAGWGSTPYAGKKVAGCDFHWTNRGMHHASRALLHIFSISSVVSGEWPCKRSPKVVLNP